jgi:tRNA threonylcarbamoyladenosine biosynthesis protein TsaB
MILLAVDTSGKQGSIALARCGEREANGGVHVIATAPLAGGTFSAQLIPGIAKLLSAHGFTQKDIGAFAAVSGPGSFTGIRVGLAAVKALAEVLGKQIAAVSLLEVIALTGGAEGSMMAALDAGRGDVYVGEYWVPNGGEISEERILSRADFLVQARNHTVVTPDLAVAEAAREAGLSVSTLAPVNAADVARLAYRKINAGEFVSPAQLEANYLRRPDAEILQGK